MIVDELMLLYGFAMIAGGVVMVLCNGPID